MIKRFAAIAIIFLGLNQQHALAQTIHCLFGLPITIDGKDNEWPQPFDYYDGNTKLQFAFANDTGNLYVCIKVSDEATQMRIFNGGLGIWLDPKGKKKETVGISFPLKGEAGAGGPGGPAGGGKHHHEANGENTEGEPRLQRGDMFKLRQHTALTQTSIRIKGFGTMPEQSLPLTNQYGINVAFAWDSTNTLNIEYTFPIRLAFGHSLTATDTVKSIYVGFIEPAVEGIKLPSSDEDNNIVNGTNGNFGHGNAGVANPGGYGGMNNGMGGMGGGGMRGGSGMNRTMPTQNPATQDQKLWSKVVLSLK